MRDYSVMSLHDFIFYILFSRMECRLLFRESIAPRMTCTAKIPPSGWKNCRKCKSRLHGVKVRADRADLLLRGPQTHRKHFVQHLVYRSVRRVNRYETSASSCNGTTKCNDLISPSFSSILKHHHCKQFSENSNTFFCPNFQIYDPKTNFRQSVNHQSCFFEKF